VVNLFNFFNFMVLQQTWSP